MHFPIGQDRYNWLDKDGMPRKPDWSQYEDLAAEVRKRRIEKLRQERGKDSILISCDEETIFTEEAALLQDHPAMRAAYYEGMLRTVQQQETDAKKQAGMPGVPLAPEGPKTKQQKKTR